MNRPVLATENLSEKAQSFISGYHQDVVKEVMTTVEKNKVVVVGMAQNPFVKKAKNALSNAGIEFKYLEYGNYFSGWKQRLAIKLWSGWPTYPQVFVNGKLIGGFQETQEALASGLIKK